MTFIVLTLFPELCAAVLGESILGRAADKGILHTDIRGIRQYSTDRHRRVGDYPFGGGGGGALTITPIAFLTVSGENVKLITIDRNETTVDKALAMAPEMVDKVANTVSALLKKDSDKTKG